MKKNVGWTHALLYIPFFLSRPDNEIWRDVKVMSTRADDGFSLKNEKKLNCTNFTPVE